jgi:cellulose synthase/poly-beta-1,6-N-acetylglucosamine synthase-like glycosyltransferase
MLALLLVYAVVLLFLLLGSVYLPVFKGNSPKTELPVTIVISARNEEQTIVACLQSILQQNYSRNFIEILLTDDASSDRTGELAAGTLKESGLQYTIVRNSVHLGKKKSLQAAILQARHELIITRDADTWTESKEWLSTIASYHLESGNELIIAPIAIRDQGALLAGLQCCENQILRIISSGATYCGFPFLNNGANFAFTQSAFQRCQGYTRHLALESGEDVFFLQEARKQKNLKIGFLKSPAAVVYTYPLLNLRDLLSQRARWSSKILKRPSAPALTLGLLNLSVNFFFLIALYRCIIYSDLPSYIFLCFKLAIDLLLLFLGPGAFEKRNRTASLIILAVLYPFYSLAVGLSALLTKPRWK